MRNHFNQTEIPVRISRMKQGQVDLQQYTLPVNKPDRKELFLPDVSLPCRSGLIRTTVGTFALHWKYGNRQNQRKNDNGFFHLNNFRFTLFGKFQKIL